MRVDRILAVTNAEMRTARRQVRYWLFVAIVISVGSLTYLNYALMHGLVSSLGPTFGYFAPNFVIGQYDVYLLPVVAVGVVLLSFDARARDRREGIIEALDARAISNLELISGRFAGNVIMAWLPLLLLAALVQAFGALAIIFDWWFGEPFHFGWLLSFLLVDTLPLTAFWCSTTMLLAVVLRNRAVIGLVALALVVSYFWGSFQLPAHLLPAFAMLPALLDHPSDILPRFATVQDLFQRGSIIVTSVGLLVLAAASHPRPDSGSPARRVAAGTILIVLGAGGVTMVALRAVQHLDLLKTWQIAHQAHPWNGTLSLERIDGTVRIDPGELLHLDITLHGIIAVGSVGDQTPLGETSGILDQERLKTPRIPLLFSFNPGMEIQALRLDGEEVAYQHEFGLLTVSPPRQPHARFALSVSAVGIPDPRFGYLDNAADLLVAKAMDTRRGQHRTEGSIFERGFVALMPTTRWMPIPGPAFRDGDPSRFQTDFFNVDLLVEAPSGWHIAGPGRRIETNVTLTRVRFAPRAPVPELALVAAPFSRYSLEAAGIEFELLVDPSHVRNVRLFADATDELAVRLAESFRYAEQVGLGYLYGNLSVVEAPARLRGYGGGWRMDSVLALPGVILMRETGFPIARFEFAFRNRDAVEHQGTLGQAKVDAMERFFESDIDGGNPFVGVARNFFLFLTSAHGEGALALNFVCHELVTRLLTDKRGFFSTTFGSYDSHLVAGTAMAEFVLGRSFVDAFAEATLNVPSVWDRALSESLADLDPREKPEQAANALALRGVAIADSLLDGLGRERAAALLSELRRHNAGRNFDVHDFNLAARKIGADLPALVGDWLHDTSLPGFLASPVLVSRLRDDPVGQPRYQIRVHIRNDEPKPGLFRLAYATLGGSVLHEKDRNTGLGASSDWHRSNPIHADPETSLEVGLVSTEVPVQLWLEPYLALNRRDVRLFLPDVNPEEMIDGELFEGVRPSTWRPSLAEGIVVDDLDPGFSVRAKSGASRIGISTMTLMPASERDQGLPVYTRTFNPRPKEWSRVETPSSWGKYRKTAALIAAGEGLRLAIFATHLPELKRWRVEYHLPIISAPSPSSVSVPIPIKIHEPPPERHGMYDMWLQAGDEKIAIQFDAAAAEPGWNLLGEFDIGQREVSLIVSDDTSGTVTVADAVRWTPVSPP